MAAQGSSFRAAAALAERAAAAQRDAFSALLARVLGALPPSGVPLSAHELAASATALGLQPQELAALAESCAAAFRCAAAEGYNPQALGDYVAAEGASAASAAFRDVWRAHGQAMLAELRGAGWGGGDALRSVSWRVVVPLAASGAPPDAGTPPEPRAVFELGLGPPTEPAAAVVAAGAAGGDAAAAEDQRPGGEQPLRTLTFEMTHDELGGLFDQLERIQGQLDAIA